MENKHCVLCVYLKSDFFHCCESYIHNEHRADLSHNIIRQEVSGKTQQTRFATWWIQIDGQVLIAG